MSYLLKVLWDGEQIVFRDLKTTTNNTLLELHHAILKAFELSADQMAGFSKIDEDLGIEVDYQLEAFDENSSLMKDVKLSEVFEEVGDLIVYTYDFLNEVTFSVELMETIDEDISEIQFSKKHGHLPKDLIVDVDPEDAESILIKAMLGDEGLEEENDDLFDNEDFESLDDYEDLY